MFRLNFLGPVLMAMLIIASGCSHYIDPGPGEEFKSAGYDDVYIIKLDSANQLQWVRTYDGYGQDYGYEVAVGDADSVYVTGQYEGKWGALDFDPGPGIDQHWPFGGNIFLTKLPPDGNW